MAAKKKIRKNKGPNKKRTDVGNPRRGCAMFGGTLASPPDEPLSLARLLEEFGKSDAFKEEFIAMVCTANAGGKDSVHARDCIKRWYKLTADDLYALCIPEPQYASMLKCTVENKMLMAAAGATMRPFGLHRARRGK